MIKIEKYLYIHFSFFMLLAAGYINRNLEIVAAAYLCVLLHEFAHMLTAVLIGLKPSHITLYPFGANLKLKNSFVYSTAEEVILYLSGPLVNALLALVILPFEKNAVFEIFYFNNISLFLFNLLPILPMDGGIVAKKLLSTRMGTKNAEKLLKIMSAIFIAALTALEIRLTILSKFNFTVLFVSVFLIGNIFTNKEKYNTDFAKELMFYKSKDTKKIKKVKPYLVKPGGSYRRLAENFTLSNSYLVFKEDDSGKIAKILTEREIIDSLLSASDFAEKA